MMAVQKSKCPAEVIVVPSVIGYELNTEQNAVANYLIPALVSCLFYTVHFASDFAVAYRHFREDNVVWGSLTIFFMYMPILGCYILTVTSWELWPEFDNCGSSNIKWAFLKTVQHIFFPVWSMWRYAERIFWSIEGVRSKNEEERDEIINTLNSPRTIELYYFLQGYLQAAPQILLQLHILMRYVTDMEQQTVDAQVFCVVMCLAQMAKVTTLFQRFKTQKIAGKSYPWFKFHKLMFDSTIDHASVRRSGVVYRCRPSIHRDSQMPILSCDTQGQTDYDSQRQSVMLRQHEDVESGVQASRGLERRRSSDFYEQPTASYLERIIKKKTSEIGRETSIVDGPERLVLRDDDIMEPDFFNPKRLLEIKGLPEDDIVGKFVAFLWWFCFLLARMLVISSFAYFYQTEIIWLLSCHFILVVALLLYDVRSDDVRRAKGVFFIFIGWVYLFCLIEFKIKFKKVKFIYVLFFTLMFTENFVMAFIWWFRDVENILNDWWFRYIFYMIVGCSFLSMLSMLFYVKVLKPKKVVIDVVPHP